MSRLRCGVVGLRRGRMFVDILSRHPQCEVTAVCDSDPSCLSDYSGLSTCTDYEQFLARGLDVVAVITPGPLHAGQSVLALQAGAHVLCETPCVYSLGEARDVVAAAGAAGRQFMLAEDFIWAPWARKLKALAHEGAFGQVSYAEGEYLHDCRNIMLAGPEGTIPYAQRGEHPDARKTWRATDLPPILYCSHTLGPLLEIMDDRVVTASGASTGSFGAPDLGVVDAQAALLTTEKGAVIHLANGFAVGCPMTFAYRLTGTAGAVTLETGEGLSARRYSCKGPASTWQDCSGELAGAADYSGVEAMVGDFLAAIIAGEPAPLDVFRSMELVLPGILAHDSARSGGARLDVPDLRGG